MTDAEADVLRVLAEHEAWVAALPAGSPMRDAFPYGLDLPRIAGAARLHLRAARRTVARLADAGVVVVKADGVKVSHGAGIVEESSRPPV